MAALHISVLFAVFFVTYCYSASLPRSFESRLSEDVISSPRKRPFCNAFTGCGRKRSQTPGMPVQEMMRQKQLYDDDLGAYLDSDPAMDELSRQILSEARLWEAMQEASEDLSRRRQKYIQ
ncbi:cardioactive peptide [Leptidea sinapis]|nr:cardioactive peptide [Leptidea sinapis]